MLTIFGLVIFRQFYLMTITRFSNTPLIVGASFPVGWTVTGLLLFIYYNKVIQSKEIIEE
ncbi:MAG: hypothetical protein GX154_10845 [Clostridiales bacterium]|nr:hypothetical protein [Clostridiales bacterium]